MYQTGYDPHKDIPVQLLEMYNVKPRNVLEIGCSYGHRLAHLSRTHGSNCYGVDASKKATEEGRRLFPNVRFLHAKASDMPLYEGFFDVIIINYVFHWIGRENLPEVVRRINLNLKKGGLLIIGDFAPKHPKVNPYCHREGLYTYKQDYGALFNYTLIGYLTTGHSYHVPKLCLDDDERYGCGVYLK